MIYPTIELKGNSFPLRFHDHRSRQSSSTSIFSSKVSFHIARQEKFAQGCNKIYLEKQKILLNFFFFIHPTE